MKCHHCGGADSAVVQTSVTFDPDKGRDVHVSRVVCFDCNNGTDWRPHHERAATMAAWLPPRPPQTEPDPALMPRETSLIAKLKAMFAGSRA